jgi:uncharacterized membrane protein (UPF0127 family)
MMKSTWRLPLLFLVLLIILIGAITLYPRSPETPDDGTVSFESGVTVPVEVADTNVERSRGLSGRDGLAEGSGMLFVFDDQRVRTFWMKEMLFSIDIIWIADGKVIGFVERAEPPSGPDDPLDLLVSPSPADYVLEVDAGFVDAHQVAVGQAVMVNLDAQE